MKKDYFMRTQFKKKREVLYRTEAYFSQKAISFIPLPQKLFFTSDVNGLHETKDYVSCGSVILCFEVVVVTREEVLLKFAASGQDCKLA